MDDQESRLREGEQNQLEMIHSTRAAIAKLYTDLHAELTQILEPPLPDVSEITLEPPRAFNTFTCFPRLPVELRLVIWEKAANIPRVLVPTQPFYRRYGPVTVCEQKGRNPTPITLRVCHESRQVTLGKYELVFGTHTFQNDNLTLLGDFGPQYLLSPHILHRLHNTFIHSPTVHFNKFVDTVYFGGLNGHSVDALWEVNALPGLRSIALDLDVLRGAKSRMLQGIFEAHPLDEVIVVIRRDSGLFPYDAAPEPNGVLELVELTGKYEKIEGEQAVACMENVHAKYMNHVGAHEMAAFGPRVAGPEAVTWVTAMHLDGIYDSPLPEDRAEPAEIDVENVDDMVEEEATNHVRFKAMGVARGGARL